MSKEETVELKVSQEFYDNVCKVLKENPWMGYESVDDFAVDAIRRRLESLWLLQGDIERIKREVGEK